MGGILNPSKIVDVPPAVADEVVHAPPLALLVRADRHRIPVREIEIAHGSRLGIFVAQG